MAAGRRQRWADHENAKREREHMAALASWQSERQVLQEQADLARTARPLTNNGMVAIQLNEGEQIVWQASDVRVVELPDAIPLFQPVHNVYSPTSQSGGYVEIDPPPSAFRDHGRVAVTNQRVFFEGGTNREWKFAELSGIAHGRDVPVTMMRVASHSRLSGLVFDPVTAKAFRFHLSLAIADFRKDRGGFHAHLLGLLAIHDAMPPAPVTMVSAEQAPGLADGGIRQMILGPPEASAARRSAPLLLATLLVAGMGIWLVSGNPAATPSSAPQVIEPGGPAISASASSAPSPTPAAIPSPTESPVVVPPAPPPTSAAPKPPPPPPPAPNTCGAPANPWGYDFCSGGDRIFSEPSNFCNYFRCNDGFDHPSANGYIVECEDGTFSHSGGKWYACRENGGTERTLTT